MSLESIFRLPERLPGDSGELTPEVLIQEENAMKYLLLIYTDEKAWTEGEREKCFAESTQLTHELHARGQYLGAAPLHPVATATSVRVRNGKQLLTDGPFAETHEQLGGFFLIEATDLNEAIAIAARIPGARKGTVEVRPVVELSGLPEVNS
jgi:hypothetical protein